MGRLKDFIDYLEGRNKVARQIEKQLCKLQQKYETYFNEIGKVHESELQQLSEHILADRSQLPEAFNAALDQAQSEVDRQLDLKLKRLRSDLHGLERKAEAARQRSLKREKAVRKKNEALDRQEEQLKARGADLQQQVEQHNRRIKELGRGWGFFANLFRMRSLAAEKGTLEQQQQDLAARIEQLREKWARAAEKHTESEDDLRQEWIKQQTRATALQTKVNYLERSQPRIRVRSTIEKVLFDQQVELHEPQQGDPPCSRCKAPNPPQNHFCQICALRLREDRPDFAGSLAEIAELNLHYQRFSDGMKACQELIGLVRGLSSGIEAFTKSVDDVLDSEKKYPLPKLQIDVPAASVAYGKQLDALRESVGKELSLHPQVFARQVQQLVAEVFTEDKIKDYFETMGAELSKQADSQW